MGLFGTRSRQVRAPRSKVGVEWMEEEEEEVKGKVQEQKTKEQAKPTKTIQSMHEVSV